MTSSRSISTGNRDDSPEPRLAIVLRAVTSWRYGKRAFDVAFATILLVGLLLVFALVAVAIKLDSPGPVFYRVRRVGYRGRPLNMLKFRKMRHDAVGGPLTAPHDSRLTRIGGLLTQTRIDELPQLWDVLCGRMSIIGPRPEDPAFVALHPAEYAHILSVRPGMTGLSQLAYAEESRIVDADRPIEDYVDRIMPQKLTLDQLYADRFSLKLDLAILRWTVTTVVFRRPVSVSRTTARMNRRRRPELTREAREARERRAWKLGIRRGRAVKPQLGANGGSSGLSSPPAPVAATQIDVTAAAQLIPGDQTPQVEAQGLE